MKKSRCETVIIGITKTGKLEITPCYCSDVDDSLNHAYSEGGQMGYESFIVTTKNRFDKEVFKMLKISGCFSK